MQSYGWPGNVRELKNMVQGLAVTCVENVIQPSHLPFAGILPDRPSENAAAMPAVQFDGRTYKEIIKDMEGVVLQAAMRKYGNIANIAKELSVDRSTIFRKIKDLEKKGLKFD